jgi:hypothetical protein
MGGWSLAARGDAGAQFGVGYSYWVGQRGLHEDAEAGRWFRLAADQGHADAQFYLGVRGALVRIQSSRPYFIGYYDRFLPQRSLFLCLRCRIGAAATRPRPPCANVGDTRNTPRGAVLSRSPWDLRVSDWAVRRGRP